MTAKQLFKQWAALEPGRIINFCPASLQAPFSDHWLLWDGEKHHFFNTRNTDGFPLLQDILQDAIAAKGSYLRLENNVDGWHVAIRAADGSKFATSSDTYPALALLEAWVNFLLQINFPSAD